MPQRRPPHLHRERTRHGALVWYVRREHGRRVRIRAAYDTPEFWAEYRAAIEGVPAPTKNGPRPGTLAWALQRYRASSAWATLSNATRRQRENIYRAIVEKAGDEPLARVTGKSIADGRETRSPRPHAANNFLKAMRGFFGWAADPNGGDLVKVDPTRSVRLLRGQNPGGFHTWTDEEVERFEERWPVGTRERLALDLLLYTGLRRGDAVRLGRQHVREGVISLPTEKTGEQVTIPLLSPLIASIAATKGTGDLVFLATEAGRPFVKESFGNWFRSACRAAGCPGSAHGLRKAGATRAADNGATTSELMAIFGWTTVKMAELYTRSADRKRLAMQAGDKLLPRQKANKSARTLSSGAGNGDKKPKISGA